MNNNKIKNNFNFIMIRSPYINIWNPLCKKYQWVRIINRLQKYGKTVKSNIDGSVVDDCFYVVNTSDNNFCPCNKFMVITEEQIFRVAYYHKFPNWVDKIKIFPEPPLGIKNVYTNKYSGINPLEVYNEAKKNFPRYVNCKPPVNCELF